MNNELVDKYIFWYKECFNIIDDDDEICIHLNNTRNSSSGFFPIISYPLILYTNTIIECNITIILDKQNIDNYFKFYNGISWVKFNLIKNVLFYEGDIKICKGLRIGFREEAYNINKIIIKSINLKINQNDIYVNINNKNTQFTIINNIETSPKLKQLEITNIKNESGITSLICHNISAKILHIKYCNILNIQHCFGSRTTPYQFINVHPFDIELTNKQIEYYINHLILDCNLIDIIEMPLFYLDYHFSNYCHFYKDTVCYINLFLELQKEIPNLKILIFKNKYPPFVLEFFHMFKLYDSIYFFEERNKNKTIFKHLYVGKYLINKTEDFKYFDLIYPFLNKLFNKYYEETTPRTEKIYISRRLRSKNEIDKIGECNYINRGCLNELEVVNFLISKNYKEIWIEDYDLIEKIKLFNKCSNIICSAGAFEINFFLIKKCNITIINTPCYNSSHKEHLLKRNINDYNMFNQTSLIYTKELINRVNNLKENNEEIYKNIMNLFESYQLNDMLDHKVFIPLLNKLYSSGSYPFIILLDKFKLSYETNSTPW